MKLTSLASLGLALFTAMGTLGSPVDSDSLASNDLNARDEAGIMIRYDGVSISLFLKKKFGKGRWLMLSAEMF